MMLLIIFAVTLSGCSLINATNTYQADEVIGKTPAQLIEMRGFRAEEHFARTRDGYYIHLVRIIHPGISSHERIKRPVIFNHGLLESSTIWLANGRGVQPLSNLHGCNQHLPATNRSIHVNGPMMLANFGYDVWLMSMRGTDWSLAHDKLKPTNPKFWDYCLDDFGLTDIPTVIDFVRSHTGAIKVGYIGHSQATFSVFALLSSQPAYADVIEPVVAVAPVSYFDHITSVARLLFLSAMKETKNLNGRFPKNADKIRLQFGKSCTSNETLPTMVCQIVDVLVGGKGKSFPPGFYSTLPFYTSYKVLRHFGQLITGKRFARYDYGPETNQQVYGSKINPPYDVRRITSKAIVLISTKTDTLSPPMDVNRFRSELAVRPYRDIFIDKDFGHFDLILHDESADHVFNPILKIFEEFEQLTGACAIHSNLEHHSHLDHGFVEHAHLQHLHFNPLETQHGGFPENNIGDAEHSFDLGDHNDIDVHVSAARGLDLEIAENEDEAMEELGDTGDFPTDYKSP